MKKLPSPNLQPTLPAPKLFQAFKNQCMVLWIFSSSFFFFFLHKCNILHTQVSTYGQSDLPQGMLIVCLHL